MPLPWGCIVDVSALECWLGLGCESNAIPLNPEVIFRIEEEGIVLPLVPMDGGHTISVVL